MIGWNAVSYSLKQLLMQQTRTVCVNVCVTNETHAIATRRTSPAVSFQPGPVQVCFGSQAAHTNFRISTHWSDSELQA